MSRKKDLALLAAGMVLGASLCGGSALASSETMARLVPQTFYVDGRAVNVTSCQIDGNNYVKLRDIGAAVGFNVYWDGRVQIESDRPYTGAAPAPDDAGALRVGSYKGSSLKVGDRSNLSVSPAGTDCTAVSSAPAVVDVESVMGQWVLAAKGIGTATVTVTAADGRTGSITITVTAPDAQAGAPVETDLNANMEIRLEMVRRINQVRRENGVSELPVNNALMNAAQACSARRYTWHHSPEESQAVADAGYPYGFGDNLTVFTGTDDAARRAVENWVNSPGHFQTMIDPRADCIGVGVTQYDGVTYCYMFTGIPNSVNFYAQ